MTERRATRLAVAALVATAALLAVGGVIYATGTEFALTDVLDAALFATVMLGMSAIGVLIAGREPRNPVGWLFSIAPLCVPVSVGCGTLGQWAGPDHHDYPGAVFPAWLSLWTWPIGLLSFAIFLPLLFPDGRPPTGRLRDTVDRRFSRAAYDAQAAVAMFAGELRRQIDLDVLSDRLLATVRDTVRPRSASVWLAPVTIPERPSGRKEA